MKQPLYTTMPASLDRKLRWQFWRLLWQKRLGSVWLGVAGATVVYACFFMLFFTSSFLGNQDQIDSQLALQNEIFEAQQVELAEARTGIYHVRRVIAEGRDKYDFVLTQYPDAVLAPLRVDVVETWQHDKNARAQVRSTAHQYPEHEYLNRELDDGSVAVYLSLGREDIYPSEREPFDAAHDLGSLYADFATATAPSVPIVPGTAKLVSASPPVMVDYPEAGIEVRYQLDPETLLVASEQIFILAENNRYEMTTITYTDRLLEPADAFAEIFGEPESDFERIARR